MRTHVKSSAGTGSSADPARTLALTLLCRAESENRPLDELIGELTAETAGDIDADPARDLDGRDLRFVRQLVAGVTKWRLHIDWILRPHSKRPLPELTATVRHALRLAVFQMRWLDRVPARAAVHSAVELTKCFEHRGAASYVNAVLRNLTRADEPIAYPDRETNLAHHLSVVHSHPRWLVERWLSRWELPQTEALLRANNEHPLLYARRNPLRAGHDQFLGNLPAGAHPRQVDETTYEVSAPEGFFQSPAFVKGQAYVQDLAASEPVRMLAPAIGERCLDLCAAPGGKAIQAAIAGKDEIELIAVDRSPQRLRLLRQSAQRLGLSSIRCVAGDGDEIPLGQRTGFDRVLVDAPCSGTGVFRRHPDARWNKRAKDLPRHAKRQLQLLHSGFRHLCVGGVLVYSTCSLEMEENDQVVESFLAQQPDARLDEDASDRPPRFQSVPGRDEGDGSFAVRLKKVADHGEEPQIPRKAV